MKNKIYIILIFIVCVILLSGCENKSDHGLDTLYVYLNGEINDNVTALSSFSETITSTYDSSKSVNRFNNVEFYDYFSEDLDLISNNFANVISIKLIPNTWNSYFYDKSNSSIGMIKIYFYDDDINERNNDLIVIKNELESKWYASKVEYTTSLDSF